MLRSYAVRQEALTRFIKLDSPCYNNGTDDVLFPFSYSNQVLDITYAGNNFESIMVDITGVEPIAETETLVRITSGPLLVSSLGDNFKTYIRAWREATIDSGSPIEIFIAPQVLRVQEVSREFITAVSGSDTSFTVSSTRPSGENYIVGNAANNYNTKYVFKTPLTFTIVEGGITQYITFKSIFDQE
jgi:hypothetical protein